jgi:hypothetical protein
MISILIDTKNPCTKWKVAKKFYYVHRHSDHAWKCDKKSWHFVAVENDVIAIGCVVLVPLDQRKQNPINANGG